MAGSWAASLAERVLYEERERPLIMSMSGRSFAREIGVREGRSQEGRRLLETPGGRRSAAEASTIVNHAAGVVVEIVFWMRHMALLCRAM